MPARRRTSIPAPLLHSAARQKDLLRGAELRAAGLSYHNVRALLGLGALHQVHRDVYKVGTPTLSPDCRLLAAVYAAGPGSALDRLDAGELQELPVRGLPDAVCVITRRGRADQPGISLRRTRRLDPEDVTSIRGIPVTTLARTVLDLADVLRPSELARVIHEAEVLGLEPDALEAARRRAPGRNTRAIAAAVQDRRPRTPREIEDKLEVIADRAGLGTPRRNSIVEVDREPFELDRYYPDLRLCLEADGYHVHKTRRKFAGDRRRDRILRLRAGITVLRYTWEDLTTRASETEAELARLRGGATPPSAS